MLEYLTYPFKTMKITQSYTGTTSHLPHTTGTPKDYPIDEGGKDTGRDPFYAPCKMKVRKIYGVGNRGTNTLWLESTEEVTMPNGKTDYVTIMIIHPNDSDLKRLKVGQTFKKGDIVCYEGVDGATGNHIHMAVGMGKMTGTGWTKNSRGKWVLTTERGTIRPEDAFYIDKSFTTVVNDKDLPFKEMPKESPKTATKPKTKAKYTVGNSKVTGANILNVRKGAGTIYSKVKFKNLTKSAQEKILKLAGKKVDGYVKGLAFTVSQVKGDWGRTPSGWVNLKYCTKI